MSVGPRPRRGLLARKSFEALREDSETHELHRTFGPATLMLFGVGCIIGSGIFVLTGNAAAQFAGPAVLISFVFAGLACGLTALCYSELASTIPVPGSAYSYSYATLGEGVAWTTGWLMVLEYGLAVSLIAVGFSGYATSFLRDIGIDVPAALATPFVNSQNTGAHLTFTTGLRANIVAAAGVLFATALLTRGISVTATVNTLIVAIKVGVLLAFVAIGIWWIEPHNWTPFIPPNEGGFAYGWPGVFRAASMIFFAYVGFETVSTAAAETRDPQKNLPIGILGALLICTVLYIAVAAVLTGVVPFRELGVPDPIAIAVNAMNLPWFSAIVKLGAIIGLCSVMLTALYGQTRVFYAVSRDGLLPPVLGRIDAGSRTPRAGTLIVGVLLALIAALLPITILSDLVSFGISLSFIVVCLSVMWLRSTRPELPRPFRVPFGGLHIGGAWIGFVPLLGMLFSAALVVPLVLDVGEKALSGNILPASLFGGYAVIGAAIYILYGRHHSKIRGDLP
jgi:APA family basic amino acid/polyamine antiporter